MKATYTKNEKKPRNQSPINFDELIDIEINKPARYMGYELGVEIRDWDNAKVRWALTYPDLYEIGASNLGHIILYSIINSVPGQICDRAYLPAKDLAKRLRAQSQPLFAVESRRPLFAFDILGFNLSYELGATNILEMLDLADIPIYSSQRNNLPLDHPDAAPLIFAGGPTATSNPEPYASFFDFFALGDGEELLPEIGLIVAKSKSLGLNRLDLLRELCEIPGVYVPQFFKLAKNKTSLEPIDTSISKRIIRRVCNPIPYYGMGLVPNIETIHDRLTIEIRRGCTRGCRFCQPGMLTRPARDVEPKEVIEAVKQGIKKTGYSDFSLLSLSCSDYLALPAVGIEIKNQLADQKISLQLPSQRVDRFNDDIAHILGGTRKSGLTFAPEAGTQRLRDVINKGLTDEDLLKGIRSAMKNGYKKIKLYFMIGLPSETDEDVKGIAKICRKVQAECKELGMLKLNITISNFTPKPHTPFQWHSVSKYEFLRRQKLLKEEFKKDKTIKANFTDIRLSALEDFIGRGNRNLAPVIEAAWRAGAGMDAWFESLDKAFDAWEKAINKYGLKEQFRKLEMGGWNALKDLAVAQDKLEEFCLQPLPWDHIDTGIEKVWLVNDLKKALQQKIVADCSFAACSSCGVCGPELGHNVIVKAPDIPKDRKDISIPTEKKCRVRFKFSKTGAMRFLSHLDLIRILERGLRRTQLPVSYSGGFHPLPRIQIGLALPLGVEAFGEWMDIDFYKDINVKSIINQLQKTLPSGFNLISAFSIPLNKQSLSQTIKSAKWSFDLSSHTSKKNIEWGEGINSIINSDQLIWNDKDKKGRDRKRDFRHELLSIRRKDNNQSTSNSIRIELATLIDPIGRSVKPIHIKHWLEEFFETPLIIKTINRDELILHKC